jgi:hypothetical protein
MTSRQKLLIGFVLAIMVALAILPRMKQDLARSKKASSAQAKAAKDKADPSVSPNAAGGPGVPETPRSKAGEAPRETETQDPSSAAEARSTEGQMPPWESKLRASLHAQANGNLKSVQLQKGGATPWQHDGVQIEAESVVIILERNDGNISMFRALVDPASGQILQTWDRPQEEGENPNHDGRISAQPYQG